jgi:hypothetical protein
MRVAVLAQVALAAILSVGSSAHFVDYTTPTRINTYEYERCKATHRCNRAYQFYNPHEGFYHFTK